MEASDRMFIKSARDEEVVTGRGCTYPLLGAEGHELPPDLLASIMILALELGAPEKLVVLGITVLGLCANTNTSTCQHFALKDVQLQQCTKR